MQGTQPSTSSTPAPAQPPASGGPKLPKKALIIALAVALGLGLLGLLGSIIAGMIVSKTIETAVEKQTGVDYDKSGGKVTITGKDGAKIEYTEDGGTMKVTGEDGQEATMEFSGGEDGKEASMPDDFPSDFPVYAGATLTGALRVTNPEGVAYTLGWSTDDETAKVAADYRAALEAKGWRVTSYAEVEGSTSLVFERGPEDAEMKDSGWLAVSTDGQGNTTIALTLSLVKR